MSYAALNAKLSAMSARSATPQNSNTITQAATDICRYITGKLQRDYVAAMALAVSQDKNIQYYTAQWKRLNRLDKTNWTALRSILGAEIDLNNILWMYRLKRYHCVTGDATFGYLVPIRYRLSRETTRRMADCGTPIDLLDEVERSPYAVDFALMINKKTSTETKSIIASESRPTPEQMLTMAIIRRYQTAARRYPNSLAATLAYLHTVSR